jgi:hypothetical protein
MSGLFCTVPFSIVIFRAFWGKPFACDTMIQQADQSWSFACVAWPFTIEFAVAGLALGLTTMRRYAVECRSAMF